MSNLPDDELNAPLIVVESDPAIRARLVMQLGELAVPLDDLSGVEERYAGSPLMVVLGPSCVEMPGLGGAEALLVNRPDIGAILIADDLSTELFTRAIRSGVRDVLGAPVDTGQLNEAVRRIDQTLSGSGVRPAPIVGIDGEGGPSGGGRVITVFSTKGGAGKSVLATNLGVMLAQRSDGPVALVDADLQFGDIAVMLKLAPQHTIVDAVGSYERLDADFLKSLLAVHRPSGFVGASGTARAGLRRPGRCRPNEPHHRPAALVLLVRRG